MRIKKEDEIVKSKEFWLKFDDLLKKLKQRGTKISKTKIAEIIGIDHQQFSRYKKGENIPPISKIIKLSQYLSLSPNDLAFLFSPMERAIGVEQYFEDWMLLNDIPYMLIDYGLRKSLFKGIKSSPDFVLLIENHGLIAVNIKYINSLSDSLVIGYPLDPQREFEEKSKVPVWFVFGTFSNQLKSWYWVPLSEIKESRSINIDNSAIIVTDKNSLLNGINKNSHIKAEAGLILSETELKEYYYIIKEAYNSGNNKIKIELDFCLRNIKNELDEYKKSKSSGKKIING